MEKGLEEVSMEQYKAQGMNTEIRGKAGASSQQHQNQIVWFGKLEHLISPGSVQKGNLRTTTPRMAPTPWWCPLGLTPS
jgi:hypothetical protein